jgi:hypothetical protein
VLLLAAAQQVNESSVLRTTPAAQPLLCAPPDVHTGARGQLAAMAALLAWYTKKLYSDPIRTKIFTSMLVNPIGAMIAQTLQRGTVDNWKEIRYFAGWGVGLGA